VKNYRHSETDEWKRAKKKTIVRVKQVALSTLRHKLDKVFSEFIRKRDSDPHTGIGRCVTCGAPGHWKDFQCGHYIKRRFLGTRWIPANCHMQCGTCNGTRRGAEPEHAAYLVKTYGPPILDELLGLKRSSPRFNRQDLLAMIAHYSETKDENALYIG